MKSLFCLGTCPCVPNHYSNVQTAILRLSCFVGSFDVNACLIGPHIKVLLKGGVMLCLSLIVLMRIRNIVAQLKKKDDINKVKNMEFNRLCIINHLKD